MPAVPDYTLPQYLHKATDPSEAFLKSYEIGASIAHQNAQLQLQQQEQAARMEMERQNQLREDARASVEQARHSVELGLRRDEIKLQQDKLQMQAKEAADFSSQQAQYASAVKAGGDPVKELLNYPALAGGSLGNLAERAAPPPPQPAAIPGMGWERKGRDWRAFNLPKMAPEPGPKPPDEPGITHFWDGKVWRPHNLPAGVIEAQNAAKAQADRKARLSGGTAPKPAAMSPVDLANLGKQIWADHPDWTKQQVIDEARRQMQSTPSADAPPQSPPTSAPDWDESAPLG